jgi:formylglycine-generating enzyme required for sulfatase activity
MEQSAYEKILRAGGEDFHAVPAGEYVIGIPRETALGISQPGINTLKRDYLLHSAPAHRRSLRACLISRFPVTYADFEAFADDTGHVTDAEREGWGWVAEDGRWMKREGVTWRFPFRDAADELCREHSRRMPVFQASWNDAKAFCAWISVRTGKTVRLPFEAEWEAFAEAAGVPGMAEAPLPERCISSPDFSGYCEAVLESIDGRGFFPAGVLWEWCEDWFDAYPGGAPNREYGRVYKVLRGGSLQSHPFQRAREYRFRRCPTARSPYYGFRIALE